MTITVANENNFNEIVLESELPTLVVFSANWCGPCKSMAPMLEKVQEDYSSVINVIKIDIDASPGLTSKYAVRSIPTIMAFKSGQPFSTHIGNAARVSLNMMVEELVS